ncbi:MAG: cupin domain-containing protein, partial [Desulfobulbia bacterium]
MGFIKAQQQARESIGDRRERYLGHTDKLMMVIIDFNDGPTSEPDPPHSHPHEQMSYVVAGELIVHIGDDKERLGPGDIFMVPPDVPHT